MDMFIEGAQKDSNEYCGLLFGKSNIVSLMSICENISKSPTLFTIAPEELIKCYSHATRKGLDILGTIHSHPTFPAYPSATDEKFMNTNRVTWIIYSCMNKNYFGYILNEEDIVERVEVKLLGYKDDKKKDDKEGEMIKS